MDLEKAVATQLANIEKRSGRSLAELIDLVHASGIEKHGERMAYLKSTLGMTHGDANAVAKAVTRADEQRAAAAQGAPPPSGADALYIGPKANLRPIHDLVMAAVGEFGPFEVAPKKTYLSLRRRKQFAMVGPATNTRVEVGLNMKGVPATDRLQELPAGQMCNYKVRLGSPAEVDAELIGWLRTAYDSAG